MGVLLKMRSIYSLFLFGGRSVTGGWAGWPIAHPDFGTLEGAVKAPQGNGGKLHY